MKLIAFLCVLLACVAPSLQADDAQEKELRQWSDCSYQQTDRLGGNFPACLAYASSTHASCPIANYKITSGGAWCAGVSNANQFFGLDFVQPINIAGIASRGRKDADQWIKTFRVKLGNDKNTLAFITNAKGDPIVFNANKDRNTIVYNWLIPNTYRARFVQIHPDTYNGHMSGRFEIMGCSA